MWGPMRLHKSYSHDAGPIGRFLLELDFLKTYKRST